MAEPTIPASHRDLLEAQIPVALATLGPTGYPQVTYVWVIVEGDTLVTSLTEERQKTKNLRAHPHGTFFVGDPSNPQRTLEIRGDVTIEPDPDLTTMVKVLTAYGTDLESFPAPLEGRVKFTLHPKRVIAFG